jgi:lipid-binding SYLF domain-containing protein
MNARLRSIVVLFLLMLPFGQAIADEYADTIKLFRESSVARPFFDKSYGYAVFPMIGKAGYVFGGAHGTGRVYRGSTPVGESVMNQVTVGFQLGGQAYSQIIFLEDKRAFDEFTSGNFEFSAQATAVAITAGAAVQGGTAGSSANASGTQHHVRHAPANYYDGMATFTITKGGLMYEASIGGQHFDFVRQGERVSQRASSKESPVEGQVTW